MENGERCVVTGDDPCGRVQRRNSVKTRFEAQRPTAEKIENHGAGLTKPVSLRGFAFGGRDARIS
jgi:hypothetical protein